MKNPPKCHAEPHSLRSGLALRRAEAPSGTEPNRTPNPSKLEEYPDAEVNVISRILCRVSFRSPQAAVLCGEK